ncbi:MAG TPA: helix-turn-helix transcriptional regulator [Candidatus Limnocylindria bacterium]|nr:helix-turn-helix transcriptional regulator [Candidatus Limnocylindria bacterium]
MTEFTPEPPPDDTVDPDHRRRVLLSAFLAEHRQRIAPEIPVLGQHVRRTEAIGKLVTRGELADASGVNRRWYELAERGVPTRASAAILRALANILGLTAEQQGVLTHLATPYLDRDAPRDASFEIRDAFASMRWYLRKLQTCSTIDEVLSLVEDTAASHFPETPCLTTAFRRPDGGWSFHADAIGRSSRLHAFNRDRDEVIIPVFDSGEVTADDLMCFPEASAPGDLLTYDDYDEATLAAILKGSFAGFKKLHEPMLAAVIRSRADFVAHLYLADFRATYGTETDRALVSAIADFASLAVSP